MYCEKCGAKLEADYNVCPSCGNIVNESMQQTTIFEPTNSKPNIPSPIQQNVGNANQGD